MPLVFVPLVLLGIQIAILQELGKTNPFLGFLADALKAHEQLSILMLQGSRVSFDDEQLVHGLM